MAEQNKELLGKVKDLESQVSALQEENTWLKDLLTQRHGSLPAQVSALMLTVSSVSLDLCSFMSVIPGCISGH